MPDNRGKKPLPSKWTLGYDAEVRETERVPGVGYRSRTTAEYVATLANPTPKVLYPEGRRSAVVIKAIIMDKEGNRLNKDEYALPDFNMYSDLNLPKSGLHSAGRLIQGADVNVLQVRRPERGGMFKLKIFARHEEVQEVILTGVAAKLAPPDFSDKTDIEAELARDTNTVVRELKALLEELLDERG